LLLALINPVAINTRTTFTATFSNCSSSMLITV
jgi:hypothetical protein